MANINVDVNIQLLKEERETLIRAHNILQEVVENLGEVGQDNADEFYNAMYGAEHIGYLLKEIGLEENEINKKERNNKQEENKELWFWNEKNNEDWFNGTFSTREEAVEEALRMAKEYGFDEFYVGKCEVVPLETNVDSENILHDLDERYCDESGCDYYIYDGVEEEHIKWLEDKMQEVIEEFHKRAGIEPNWFNVVDTELIKVDEINI